MVTTVPPAVDPELGAIWIMVGGGAGGSKSFIGCYWILKMCFKYEGTRWLIGRSKLKTLKETTLNTMWEVMKLQGIPVDTYRYNSQMGTIDFINGSQILLKDLFTYPSDPNFDGLGSLEITGAFIDECNQISEKAWNIVNSRIRYKLDENDLIHKLMGSCNPSKGYVYNQFYKVRNTLPKSKAFIQALVGDNPFISKHYVENLKQLDQASKERLLYGNWEYDDDPYKLMNYDAIVDIFTNDHIEKGTLYITCDVARFGADKTVILVWEGWRVIDIYAMAQSSITDTTEAIQRLKRGYGISMSNIIVDEDGVGGGVKDVLKCKGFVNGSKALIVNGKRGNFNNLKSQCYYKVAEKVNKGEVYIECKDIDIKNAIIEELEVVRADKWDNDGKKRIEPKDKVKDLIGRSPDYADAIAMRWFFDSSTKAKYKIG